MLSIGIMIVQVLVEQRMLEPFEHRDILSGLLQLVSSWQHPPVAIYSLLRKCAAHYLSASECLSVLAFFLSELLCKEQLIHPCDSFLAECQLLESQPTSLFKLRRKKALLLSESHISPTSFILQCEGLTNFAAKEELLKAFADRKSVV